jgi:ribosomal protein S1
VGHSTLERLLHATTKKSALKQKIITAEEARPGQLLSGTISAVKANGLTMRFGSADTGGYFPGYVTKLHLPRNAPADEGTKWQKGLERGQEITCRVLYFDETKGKLILTAKPALVELEEGEKPVVELNRSLAGKSSKGIVIRVMEGGSCLIGFFNRVVGLLRASDVKRVQESAGAVR